MIIGEIVPQLLVQRARLLNATDCKACCCIGLFNLIPVIGVKVSQSRGDVERRVESLSSHDHVKQLNGGR